jgi:hypothetical protein
MIKPFAILIAAISALVAKYLFDPQQGEARRAKLRDQVNSTTTQLQSELEAKTQQFRDAAQSAMSDAQKQMDHTRETVEHPPVQYP